MMPARRLPLVIVNPASRGGAGGRDWPSAAVALATYFGTFDCRFTESAGHAVDIAEEEANSGRALLLTFGGDGTISETARGILRSGAPCELGVLPHGTGGDFIRSLGSPSRVADTARGLRRGRTIVMDVGRVRFSDGTEWSFINSASFGLSAEVARRANRLPKSRASYVKHTVEAALAYDFPDVTLRVEGKSPRRLAVTTVSLHNGRFFGGGMKMAPEASLTDGALDVIVVRKMPLAKLLGRAPLLFFGAHLGLDEVEHGRVTELEAEAVAELKAIPVEVDGESPGCLPARFDVRRSAIRLRLPTC
jgi:diacylglycerol kinase (ATP)